VKTSPILIVEDEPALREALRFTLAREGYTPLAVVTGEEALSEFQRSAPSLVILDLGLPDLDGLEVCRAIRSRSATPILVLTARRGEIDKIVGLDMGADDYMTKPFSMRELLARVRAVLRRGQASAAVSQQQAPSDAPVQIGSLVIDRRAHRVMRDGQQVALTPKEFELLAFLAENKGLVFGRETLLDRVWGYAYPESSRTVDVHVRWLRQKLEEDPTHPRYILTVRGVGYKLED
jgi:DNA-binding response OmpR family regulator